MVILCYILDSMLPHIKSKANPLQEPYKRDQKLSDAIQPSALIPQILAPDSPKDPWLL
jgi:hypothetical protein